MKTLSAAIALFLLHTALNGSAAQPAEKPEKAKTIYLFRYSMEFNPRLYPQKTPKDALASIVKALSDERMEYLMAHLADPAYVDPKVDLYKRDYAGGDDAGKALLAFQRLVRETTKHYFEDAELIKELRRFSRDAAWEETEDKAVGNIKELPGRQVILRRLEGRWFLKNRQAPEPPPEK